MAYSTVNDLDWGNIPAPDNALHWLDAGADEIDSEIGHIYVTPVVLNESDSIQRPGYLLLKRINEWLAMGRGILSVNAGNAEDQNHALGLYYVNEARAALLMIKNGDVILHGAIKVESESSGQTGPLVGNVDEESTVEAFRSTFGDPAQTVLNIPRCPSPLNGFPGHPYTW